MRKPRPKPPAPEACEYCTREDRLVAVRMPDLSIRKMCTTCMKEMNNAVTT